MNHYIGIDLGTSAVKVLVVDAVGTVVALRERNYPILHPAPGFAEQSPATWWEETVLCVREILAEGVVTGESVKAIGLSGQMHGVVLVDSEGSPVRNAIIWPDTRSAEICAEWTQRLPVGDFHEVTGLPLATGFFAPSLEWVRRHERPSIEQADYALLPKDYLRMRMTGHIHTDPSDASGTYLFDIRTRTWAAEVTEQLGIDMKLLPEIRETLTSGGSLTREAADELGLPAGIPVAMGGSDQAMAALGMGLRDRGNVAIAISTGGTTITPVETPMTDRRLHTLCHAFPDRWLLMGATLSAGAALTWYRDVLEARSLKGHEQLRLNVPDVAALADTVSPGAEGLFFLPYLSGERTPHMNPNAQGSFVGLTLYHTAAHMVRAIMEGVAYSLYDSAEVYRELGLSITEALCYAGGSRSDTWRQIIADVFSCPVRWKRFSDYSALGAAFGAAEAIGAAMPPQGWEQNEEVISTPNTLAHDGYALRVEIFRQLYDRIGPLFDTIAKSRAGDRSK